jgi:hypothetical protein
MTAMADGGGPELRAKIVLAKRRIGDENAVEHEAVVRRVDENISRGWK